MYYLRLLTQPLIFSTLTKYTSLHRCQNIVESRFFWPRLRTAQVYRYNHKYLQGSFTARSFSKVTLLGSTLKPMTSPVMGFFIRIIALGMKFFPVEKAKIPFRKWSIIS